MYGSADVALCECLHDPPFRIGQEAEAALHGGIDVALFGAVPLRTERVPSGLLVAEYREDQMVGEKDIGLLQESTLLGNR